MKKLLLSFAVLSMLATPLSAKNFAVPDKDPAATLTVPDNWKVEEIEYGFSAQSPGDDVFFSMEYASKKKLDGMMKTNEAWMKDNDIDFSKKPEEREMDFNGISGTVLRYDTTDANGPTLVDFVLLPAGKNRVVMLTLWGSETERKKHKAAITSIMESVRPIN
ncbi:hypothetical protein [Microvirga brassicacearum]|uniref:DUF1795 domain-containing protein n=1 Tax=Microvirga brassicacearum TaxID=2580413 RepID=A0A5N3P5C5_9HYPH|nr:hypothetical protein [Microvirga brassicacearum]KAB0264947.1 hypothetical protein FEZ63_20650 [Microvirga brassicacearum]